MDRLLVCCCPISFFGRARGQGLRESLLLESDVRIIYGTALDEGLRKFYKVPRDTFFHIYIKRSIHEEVAGGWKIHIALTNDISQVSRAWHQVILPILIKYRLGSFKIVKEESLITATTGKDCGKVVTLYLFYNPELRIDGERNTDLRNMLLQIHQGLTEHNIDAGDRAKVDAIIGGSPYFSYRCDAGNRPGDRAGTFLPVDSHEAMMISKHHGYELAFMSALNVDSQPVEPDKGKIYVAIENAGIKYSVINLEGSFITDAIDVQQLGKAIPLSVEELDPLFCDILIVTSFRGHTRQDETPLYNPAGHTEDYGLTNLDISPVEQVSHRM